jgi:hypothetical protein
VEAAVAEQARHVAFRRLRKAAQRHGELPRIELRIAAQRTVRGEVGDQEPDRSVAADLQGEDAVVFQRRRQRRAERHGLGERPRHGQRIAVALDDGVEGGAQTHQPAAHPQRIELEGQRAVPVGRFRVGS